MKKPFNPVIGETFACMWKHEDGSRSQYFSEQVAHRPPVSAIYFENRRHGITASAHVWTKSQFSAPQTVKSILDGVCLLHFAELDEVRAAAAAARSATKGHSLPPRNDPPTRAPSPRPAAQEYYITFPTYYAHNLLIGTLRTDIGDTAHIICSKTGLRADIDFLQMGVLSPAERLFGVEGLVRRMPEGHAAAALKKAGWFTRGSTPEGEPVAAVSGHFTKSLFWTPTGGAQQLLLDIAKAPVAPKYVLPQELQGPWESRRLWRFAAADLLVRPKVDWASVDHEKAQLEEEQRLVPCHAAKPGAAGFEEWPTKKFHLVKVPDLVAGGEREVYLYDGFDRKKRADDAAESNLLALSRSLPDPRGGLKGAGASRARARSLPPPSPHAHRPPVPPPAFPPQAPSPPTSRRCAASL